MRHYSPVTGKEEKCSATSIANCPYTAEQHINNFQYAVREAEEIRQTQGEDSHAYKEAVAFAEQEEKAWDATPDGIKELNDRILNENNVGPLRARLIEAESRNLSYRLYDKEQENGRAAIIAKLADNPYGYFDQEELDSIVDSALHLRIKDNIKGTIIPREEVTAATYKTFCETVENETKLRNGGKLTEEQEELIKTLKTLPPVDSSNLKMYKSLVTGEKIDLARKCLKKEIGNIAALQNVDYETAEAFYNGYRNQYLNEFAHLPEKDQPNPPKHWVKGKNRLSGFRNDYNSALAPSDPASMYAVYRLRADSSAIPDTYKTSRLVASIDLETAGEGKAGFNPKNGSIIEVGIVTYDPKTGKEVDRYEQLVKPDWLALKKYGTGAVDVHGITVDDVKDSPAWVSVKDDVMKQLEGKTLLAQNSSYEEKWLVYHGDKELMNKIPIIDTLDMSRKHNDLSNHKLETICNSINVPYTNGHRATHDALVTGEAAFALRKKIERTWKNKPARAKAPALTELPKTNRFL